MRAALSHGGSRAALVIVAALLAACGAGSNDAPLANESEATGDLAQPIYGGSETTRTGVVRVDLGVPFCSGVMINSHVVITAGHCAALVLPPGAKTALTDNVQITYVRASGPIISWAHGGIRVTQWPGYTTGLDAENDFAVLYTEYPWEGAQSTDYAYIYTDTMSAYSRLQLYGFGANSFAGTGGGVLRTGTMEVDWFGSQHFILHERGARFCRGDSGGPAAVYESATGGEMQVVGLASNFEATPSGQCGAEGANARYTRLSGKVEWIKQVTGARCVQMNSQKTNRLVTRCFDYSTLKRTVRDCKTRNALGPEQTIDLSSGYSNYRCGDRYQEQCVADGTPDTYYVETCL